MIFLSLFALIALAEDPTEEAVPALEALLPDTPSWTTVKKRLYTRVHIDRPATFYCTCVFDQMERTVDLKSCLMEELSDQSRALRVEAEHVVPASVIGAERPCWEEGGRSHCLKVDEVFKTAHNDLHNVRPAVGAVNAKRSNYSWGLLAGEPRVFGSCDFEVDSGDRRAEPAAAVRGDIARTYFYMEFQYGVSMSEGQRRLFLHWHAQDPVDSWERERDRRIEELQGNSNPFVR